MANKLPRAGFLFLVALFRRAVRRAAASNWIARVRAKGGSCRGFTLIEVLIAIVFLVLVFGLTLAGVQHARQAAAKTQCASNQGQLSLAIHSHAAQLGKLPSGCAYETLTADRQGIDQVGISWQTAVLPHIEQSALSQQAVGAYQRDPRGESDEHARVRVVQVVLFLCPTEGRTLGRQNADFTYALTSYRGVAGTGLKREDGLFHQKLVLRFSDVTDGTSNTLMIGERPPGPNGVYGAWYSGWGDTVCPLTQILPATHDPWLPSEARGCADASTVYRPGSPNDWCHVNHFWSPHTGGAHFAFADGSVRFLRYSADDIMPALATRAGGETVVVPE